MSVLREKWSVEDVKGIIRFLDLKVGMNGIDIPVYFQQSMGMNGEILGSYQSGLLNAFTFSRQYFDDPLFPDMAAIDVVRHEYCHYLVDALKLNELYEDDDPHGMAWKSACSFLNTDDTGTYNRYHFCCITKEQMNELETAKDIVKVDIPESLAFWGLDVLPARRREALTKKLVKKYGKTRVFKIGDKVIHNKRGYGVVLDVRPEENKQRVYVHFDNDEKVIVQNRQLFKVVNGKIIKPKAA